MIRAATLAYVLASGCLASGCAVTDTGNPPMAPEVDTDRVRLTSLFAGLLTLSAAPGSVDPPRGVVRVTNLDTAADAAQAPVAEDGSFELGVGADLGNELRLQIADGALRSEPVDFVDMGEQLIPIERALACVTLDPPLDIDAGTLASSVDLSIVVTNGCAQPISLATAPRRTTAGISISAELGSTVVEPSATTSVRVSVDPIAPGSHEEVLFITIAVPVSDRRPITIHATVP